MKPPFPANAGAFGCPTTVNNLETIAAVPTAFGMGCEEWSKLSLLHSIGDGGTRLYGVNGNVKKGAAITEQGEAGDELFLVLDGVVRIEVDGKRMAEYGPGSMHGERAILEGGKRTSTIRAVTDCKLAVAGAGEIDRDALTELSSGHRREEQD